MILFIATAVYLGVYVWRGAQSSLQTSPAVLTTLTESAEMTGLAVREELVMSSDRAYVFVNAEDGSQVSRDAVLAAGLDSESAMERSSRKKQLENEIAHIETVLSGLTGTDDLTERSSAVRRAVLQLSASIHGGSLSDLDGACASLSSLVFTDSGAAVSQEDLDALRSELSAMEGAVYSDSEDITAPVSGLFTTVLDGYEGLTPSDLSDLTPSGLRLLMKSQTQMPSGAFGKLITGWRWYFAALIDRDSAELLTVGDYVTVALGGRNGGDVSMRVESVSAAQSGECAVVFSTLKSLSDTVTLRLADAQVMYTSVTGLRVPTRALHVDEDGNSFVYVAAAGLVDVRYVTTIKEAGEYYLVAVEPDTDALREGDEIIVSGRNVSEGMVVR